MLLKVLLITLHIDKYSLTVYVSICLDTKYCYFNKDLSSLERIMAQFKMSLILINIETRFTMIKYPSVFYTGDKIVLRYFASRDFNDNGLLKI